MSTNLSAVRYSPALQLPRRSGNTTTSVGGNSFRTQISAALDQQSARTASGKTMSAETNLGRQNSVAIAKTPAVSFNSTANSIFNLGSSTSSAASTNASSTTSTTTAASSSTSTSSATSSGASTQKTTTTASTPVDVLNAALKEAGIDPSSLGITVHDDDVVYPGGSGWTNHLITLTANGHTESYDAAMTAKYPGITVCDIKRLLAMS